MFGWLPSRLKKKVRATQMSKQQAIYGGWKSPISAKKIADGSISLSQVIKDGKDIYWIEGRPKEGGRSVSGRRNGNAVIADAIV